MTVGDFLKRVSVFDGDKMMIFSDGKGWSNIDIEVNDNEVVITCDRNEIFSSDK